MISRKEYFYFSGCLLFIVLIQLVGAFTNPTSSENEIRKLGFSNIVLIRQDYMFVAFRGCDRDLTKFTFAATNNEGIQKQIVSCVPLFGNTKIYLKENNK